MERTADEVANDAIMTRKRHAGKALILLVEGYNDEKTFSKFLASVDTEIISSWGKDNVLDATAILEREGHTGILGIVDADFWHLDGQPLICANVIVTDEHDIEMMMVHSRSFSHFIAEVASASKIESFLITHKVNDIRDILLELALPLGCLRRYSHTNGLNLFFKNLKFSKFIEKKTLKHDLEKMVEVVLSLTRNPALNLNEIISQVRVLVDNISDDPYQICCGHDVIAILGVGLRKCIGSKSKEAASSEVLESELRMSYDIDCFRQTQLYSAAEEWSRNNAPYRVFA